MIMKAMAITRCPYCHAIIDENDKYCNNCGTQLLFPEDEETDEEIPGEKILDAEVEEKDYTIDEPEGEKRPRSAADDDEDVDERLEEEMRDRAAETALDEIVAEGGLEEGGDDVTEEVILVDELKDTGLPDTAGAGEIEAKTGEDLVGVGDEEREQNEDASEKEEEAEEEAGEAAGAEAEEEEDEEEDEKDKEGREIEAEQESEEKEEEAEEEEGGEEDRERERDTGAQVLEVESLERPPETEDVGTAAPDEEEPEVEYLSVPTADGEAGPEEVASPRSVTFDTQELEGIGQTVELSKDKVERLVAGMAEKGAAAEPAAVAMETPREPTGSLPPWASGMKGAPVFPPDSATIEGRSALRERGPTPEETEEVEIFPKRRSPDSTLGLPERVGQSPLPFERNKPEEDQDEEDAGTGEETEEETAAAPAPEPGPVRPAAPPEREPGTRRIEAGDEYEEAEPRGPFSFTVFLKSKAFDLLFVGLFWLVALWLAAHATDRTLFEVLGAVSGPMLLLYGVFVLLYFFLFKFFLGETLGDRLFRPRD